ncbi:MAG: hypothetical protein M5U26_00455 [Planctomycetota bacterium]|nr:hypothetical protein [Planctomycetota bacterium]
MYADAATNNGRFPDDGVSALQSMNLLYRGYIRDARVFQCPQNPKDPLALNDIAKDLPNMTNAMTAYGYDRGHMQSDGMAGIASDYGARDEKVGNSTNHGADHGVGAGQQFLQGDGHVEWLKSPGRDTDQDGVDDDFIFDDDREAAGVENDSWIRDD